MTVQKKFAIIGHKAPSKGDLFLNDLPGLSGRMDVLARAINATLFLSHGIRHDSQIIVHLTGGNGPPRRVLFDGSELGGVRPDERSISGHFKSIIKTKMPPIGIWKSVSSGIYQSGGGIEITLKEWEEENVSIYVLDKKGSELEYKEHKKIGFLLSDDIPFTAEEYNIFSKYDKISLGEKWLQGQSCITILHHLIDSS
jgi:tRNA (pseudouridine54-N1)-methyltransferase